MNCINFHDQFGDQDAEVLRIIATNYNVEFEDKKLLGQRNFIWRDIITQMFMSSKEKKHEYKIDDDIYKFFMLEADFKNHYN